MDDRSYRMNRNRLLRAAAVLAAMMAAAAAQAQPPTTPASRADAATAAPSSPVPATSDPLEGVTVNGARPEPKAAIPADKRAEYDAAVAKEAAFREYRRSTPPLVGDDKGVANSNDLSKDFPGLQAYVPAN